VPVSRRAWSTSLALASVGLPTHEALAAASSTDTAPGLARVVLKTASILPETAAEYLVSALGLRLLTEDEDQAVGRGRIVVGGSWGIALELRGGGDDADVAAGEIAELPGLAAAPRLTCLFVASENPAKARNTALRNGAIPLSAGAGPAGGERCAGDAYAGCAANLVGLPVSFVKANVKSSSAIVRVGVESRGDARKEASDAFEALGGMTSFSALPSPSAAAVQKNKTQPGVVDPRRGGCAVSRGRERRRSGAVRRGRGRRRGDRGGRGGEATRGACWRWKRGAARSTRRGEFEPSRGRLFLRVLITTEVARRTRATDWGSYE
jgi:hypothetical protein